MASSRNTFSATVKYEKYIDIANPQSDNEATTYGILQSQGLDLLVSHKPAVLLDQPVVDFVDTLSISEDRSEAKATIYFYQGNKMTSFKMDVRRSIINTFKLSTTWCTYDSVTTEELTPFYLKALIDPNHRTPFRTANFHQPYKTLINILHHCVVRQQGSYDQVSLWQRQFIASLFIDGEWDWTTIFLGLLSDEQAQVHTSKKVPPVVRIGLKISAIILHSPPLAQVPWENTREVEGLVYIISNIK